MQRFRGIRSAEVSFEQTTVLIGENDCGMTSVLEALALALSPAGGDRPVVEPRQFHLASDSANDGAPGSISIEVTLEESRAGSWGRPGLEALDSILPRRATKPRSLILEITASPPDTDQPVDVHWVIRSPRAGTSRDDVAALAAIRGMNPLVWLRHGTFVRPESSSKSDRRVTSPFHADSDAAAVLRGYELLLRGASNSETGVVESGFSATQRLLAEWAPGLRRTPEMRAMVAEILEHGASIPVRSASPPAPVLAGRSGSAAQELGVFLLAAQLVHELRRTAAPGVRPIILIEEPEAHLHPMTLASVWTLLELFNTQKIITTHSGTLLTGAPLTSLRRLVRDARGGVREQRVGRDSMSSGDLRKVSYHLRARRSVACFARVWLLVEGETEFWILPDLARLCGYDMAQEGIVCVEFAQCGLAPLVKLANSLGIEWHVLTDGDRAGIVYVEAVRPFLRGTDPGLRLTQLAELDIEHCFWAHGYASVFEGLAGMRAHGHVKPSQVIRKALDAHSKPGVALELLSAVAARGIDGIPPPLRTAIETCVWLARGAGARDARPFREAPRAGTHPPQSHARRRVRASRRIHEKEVLP